MLLIWLTVKCKIVFFWGKKEKMRREDNEVNDDNDNDVSDDVKASESQDWHPNTLASFYRV